MGKKGRTPLEVFDDHLRKRQQGALEEDLAENYADAVVVLTGYGIFRGKEGLRCFAALFQQQLPLPRIQYRTKHVEGELAFLEWTALSVRARIRDGADSFWIRDGKIVAQTVHYTVERISTRGPGPTAGRK